MTYFLRFWFRYVHPNQSGLELGLADAILQQRILPDLDHFVASAFEEAAIYFTVQLAQTGKLTFLPGRIGGWWNRNAKIDVLAVNLRKKVALLGECKWNLHPLGIGVLDDLKQKAQVLRKEHDIQEVQFMLFARRGFTPEFQEIANREGVRLYTVDDLVNG